MTILDSDQCSTIHSIDKEIKDFFDEPSDIFATYEQLKGFLSCLVFLGHVDLQFQIDTLKRYENIYL